MQASRKLGHERDTGLFDSFANPPSLLGFQLERVGAIYGFARIAGRENWQRPPKIGGQDEHCVDIFASGQSSKAIHDHRIEVARGPFGQVGYLGAHSSHLEAIRQRSQRRSMPSFPGVSEPNDSHPQFHGDECTKS